MPDRVVVVGAGLAGLGVVEELRRLGSTAELVLLGAEAEPPYDRPPLSKQVLRGEKDTTHLRTSEQLDELGVRLELGRPAIGLEPGRVLLEDSALEADAVVIATGGQPRQLPGLDGVHYLRTLDDARRAGAAMRQTGSVTVVGGGFIGCEVASSAVETGARAVVVELLPQPMHRALGDEVSSQLAQMHREAGVELRTGVAVQGRTPSGELQLSDGSTVDGTTVVVGLGVVPDAAWLADSGVLVEDAVQADETGRTAVEGVWALGDVAAWWRPELGAHKRVEHWDSARHQAAVVARDVLGLGPDPDEPPHLDYFWSDQLGLKLQALGSIGADDEVTVLRSGPKERLLAVYGRDGVVTAVFAAGLPRKVMGSRDLLLRRAPYAEALEWARS